MTSSPKIVPLSDSGMSLLAVMVGISLLGVFAYIASGVAENTLNAARIVSDLGEKEDIRRLIRMRLDCNTTKKKANGKTTGIVFYDRNGQSIIPTKSDGSMQLAGWKIEASFSGAELNVLVSNKRSSAKELFNHGVRLRCP